MITNWICTCESKLSGKSSKHIWERIHNFFYIDLYWFLTRHCANCKHTCVLLRVKYNYVLTLMHEQLYILKNIKVSLYNLLNMCTCTIYLNFWCIRTFKCWQMNKYLYTFGWIPTRKCVLLQTKYFKVINFWWIKNFIYWKLWNMFSQFQLQNS